MFVRPRAGLHGIHVLSEFGFMPWLLFLNFVCNKVYFYVLIKVIVSNAPEYINSLP